MLVQYGPERHADMPDVPAMLEFAQSAEGRAVLAFYISSELVGRSLMAPPGIPADRVNTLRRAFEAMLKDRDFLAEIKKSGQEFYPANGEELQRIIGEAASAPRNVIDRTQSILRGK